MCTEGSLHKKLGKQSAPEAGKAVCARSGMGDGVPSPGSKGAGASGSSERSQQEAGEEAVTRSWRNPLANAPLLCKHALLRQKRGCCRRVGAVDASSKL